MSSVSNSLADLKIGEKCRVVSLTAKGDNRRRMLDLGIIPGTEIKAMFESPSGGVMAYLIRGTMIAIRREDAVNIVVL